MFIEISDPALVRDLIEFLRERNYLAVEEWGHIVAVPLQPQNRASDRRRCERDLGEWRIAHPGVRVAIIAD
jgi:hypothetical protein